MIFYGGYIKNEDKDMFNKVLFRSTRGMVFVKFFALDVAKHDTFSDIERAQADKIEQPFFKRNMGYIIMFHHTPQLDAKVKRITESFLSLSFRSSVSEVAGQYPGFIRQKREQRESIEVCAQEIYNNLKHFDKI